MSADSQKKFPKWLTPIGLLLFGVVAGFFLRGIFPHHARTIPQHQEIREGGYSYINPLVACESSEDAEENTQLKAMKRKLEKAIEDQIKRKWTTDAAVYFRLLNSGRWISIKSNDTFSPGSLLKVPVMIAVLKEEERRPSFAGDKIIFRAPTPLGAEPNYKPSKILEAGESYTVDDLLYRMIVYSDNDAMYLLMATLDKKFYEDLVNELNREFSVPPPQSGDYMTVEEYAAFFRVLFNATYLSKEMSEKALGLLVKTEFNEGLNGGVPSRIPIAHKFGERVYGRNNEAKQLHDCGIVYYPDHPYLLCVMTTGTSFEYLDDGIREISRIVYEGVDRTTWRPAQRLY